MRRIIGPFDAIQRLAVARHQQINKAVKIKEKSMSFLSVFKTVAVDALKVLGVASEVAPLGVTLFAPALSPAASKILSLVSGAIVHAESVITGVQQGVAKKESATDLITTALPNVAEIISSFGPNFTYDAAMLSTLIDATVAEKNALAKFVASFMKN